MQIDLPPALIESLRSGKILLFLGSGASANSVRKDGSKPPMGGELADLLSEKFLGGRYNGKNLTYVSALAISETNTFQVQEYIRDIFKSLEPSKNHLQIPTFNWRGIFTTNYDTLIEDAYRQLKEKAAQEISPLISNNDIFDAIVSDRAKMPLFKLHGCITKVRDPHCLLILTTDQYISYRKGRDHLFDQFSTWAREYPILFIGHGLEDTDIREALSRLEELVDRPRSFLISRQKYPEEKRFWEQKKITAIDGTFDDFIETIQKEVPEGFRGILAKLPTDHPIERKFIVQHELSKDTINFLEKDVDYLHSNISTETQSIESFYRGFDLGWFGIEKKLDIERELLETLLWSVILLGEEARSSKADFYVIKAPAGAGKTVLLRRLAWETGITANQISLYLKEASNLRYEALHEIHLATKDRIFLFINNASDLIHEIESVLLRARKDKLPLTIIVTERNNEWNMNCEPLDKLVSGAYDLPYLSRKEIIALLGKLEEHNLLNHLKPLSEEQRIKSLEKRSGRQLLVALHEVTLGKGFEDIIIDEYNEIKPQLAQSLYLTICTLNRYRIPVRAGVISRLYGIIFTDFYKRFLGPLEEVVQTSDDLSYGDFNYRARHPQIAEIVFQRVLANPDDKFAEYAKVLQALNISYSVDYTAFKKLLQAKALLDLFPDHSYITDLFKIADKLEPNSSYVSHQRGVYEMNRDNGSWSKAAEYLQTARRLNGKDNTIVHSLAELANKRADEAKTDLEKEKFRREAEQICASLLRDPFTKRHARNTIVKIGLNRLEDGLERLSLTEPEIDDLIHEIEKHIENGLQEYASDSHLLLLDSRLKNLLNHKVKALAALEKAFDVNKRDQYVAIRLAKAYESTNISASINVLREALEANPGNSNLHYALARFLQTVNFDDYTNLVYHFKRGFTPSDKNYNAQFWFAFYSYVIGDLKGVETAKKIFRFLRDAPIPFEDRMKIRYHLKKNGDVLIFEGKVTKKSINFGFVVRDGIGDEIFIHTKELSPELWKTLNEGNRMSFSMGFNYSGPVALDITIF